MTGHGGNIYRFAEKLKVPKGQILDFSASINPLGLPQSVVKAIREIDTSHYHYPDPDAHNLRRVIAEYHNIEPESIICGNGSTELIYLCARALKPATVLIPSPTFSEYERACRLSGANIKHLILKKEDGFALNPSEYIRSMNGCTMAFICNPNNPTGRLISLDELMEIAAAARELKCYLIVDEAFIDFLPECSIIKEVKNNPYLIVLRSLTKFYALSGLRLGFGVFPMPLIDIILQSKEPWTVSSLAQKAGVAALADNDYKQRTFKIIEEGKSIIEKGLKRLSIEYVPSAVNYYLLKMKNAREITVSLYKAYIMVRDCSNFRGLDDSYIRVAVKSQRDITILLKEVSKLCGR